MKKVIIIGAGIAGLTAGVYARQSGFDVTVYESHSIPGGASTSWRRKGYLFEGGMHWLTGSSPATSLNKLWKEIGALDDTVEVYNRDPFFIYEDDGKTACLYRNIDKLRQHFLELSPEDEREIGRLCKDLKKFTKMNMPVTNVKGVKMKEKAAVPFSSMLSMLPAMARMPFYAGQTAQEYAMRYKSPFLRQLLMSVVGDENSAVGLVFTLATLACGDGGYPLGGSLAMARRIAERFMDLGGKIQYNTLVNQVVVKDKRATGVVVDGKEIFADAVIVTQDTLAAIDQLFAQPIQEPWAQQMRRETKPMLNTFVCLGIKADLSSVPENIGFRLETPIFCAEQKVHTIGVNNYATYPGYAPKGCTALTATFMGDSYDWWKRQKENGTYEMEKKRFAEAVIAALARKFPQIKDKVEVWDVATPLTYERYLHSYKGSWMSIMGKGAKMTAYPGKPESITSLYFAGQRLMLPGGLPVAAETGRKAVQHLCKDMDSVFQGNS